MSESTPAYIAGAFEHPCREAPKKSTMQLHAEVARGALRDAGVEKDAVDGYFTAGIPEYRWGLPPLLMADYLGLDVAVMGSTDIGGSAYISHVGHAVSAILNGKCDVVLITLAARPRSQAQETGTSSQAIRSMQDSFEHIYGTPISTKYAMAARRHMHEYGTSEQQLAEVRVAASHHAQYNDDALYRETVTVEDVVTSPIVADPLHVLDCCVITDGGGAIVVVSENVRQELDRECVEILGHGEAVKHHDAGRIRMTTTGAEKSSERAYEESNTSAEDIDYVSLYDSFTITVLETLEDLGFCEKGAGGEFVEGGTLKAPDGDLPVNTDGGGLCSNHPDRGGMTKIIEAVRQLRGEANDEVQLDAEFALVHGTGGNLTTRVGASTLVLGGGDR